MKILLSFLITYVFALSLIFVIHFHLESDYNLQAKVTKSEIHGLSYLTTLYKLSINIATLNNKNNYEKSRKILQRKVLTNIDALYSLQKENRAYINKNFNIELEKLKKFNMTTEEYYDFLELIGLENYRIGDVSKLLFECDRKIYFLSSLATHYMPEYLISILINHNIVKELQEGNVSRSKEDIFTEQTKLIFLSSEEIYVIIKEVSQYQDSKLLLTYMNSINKELNKLSHDFNIHSLFNGDNRSVQRYLNISENILYQSFLLNNTYIKIIEENLNNRLDRLKSDVVFLNITLSFIVFLITVLFLYVYKLYRSREKQHLNLIEEQKKTQEALNFKSQFLSNMSHEIRTPLNTIVGLIKVILKTELSPKQSDILHKVSNASDLLLGVINDILDIAKIESGKLKIVPHDFDLKTTTSDIQDMFLQRAEEKNIQLKLEYENIHNFNLHGDSLRISQILINFISNAIKFTSSGTIILYIKGLENNNIMFAVKDNGIGIKEEYMKTLFEEFTQADMDTTRKYGGTGLGLSISKNLVEMMGGKIDVTSKYNVGSTFSFTIALPPSKNTKAKESKIQKLEDLETEINQLKDITILIAEDNKMNQTLVSMLLEDSQFTLEFANDGEIAVEMFKKKKYDLILMDIQMPNINGYEACKMIREMDGSIPILALSANVMQEDIEKSLQAGMDCHLAKPIILEKLYLQLLKFLKPKK